MQERRATPALTGTRRASLRRVLTAAAVAGVVLAADQTSKTWAVHRLSRGPIHVWWKLDLELGYNSGASFSIARGWAPVLAGVAIVLVAVLAVAVTRSRSAMTAVALGLVGGGALGNLADRLLRPHHGGVVDFIAFHFWPTFNVADSSIVVGGVLLAWSLWRESDRRQEPA